MMIKDIYCKFSLNPLKIDQLFSMKLFKEEIIQVLVLETLRVYLSQLKRSKIREEILQIYDLLQSHLSFAFN